MRLLLILFIFTLLLNFALPSNAQGPLSETPISEKNARTMFAPPPEANGLTVQTKSIAEIDRRINMLNSALEEVNGIKFLSANEKGMLTQKIQTELATLNALKQKISANNDPTMLKNDIASVSASHKTFAFVFPQAKILLAADKLNNVANMLSDYAQKLEERITQAKSQGNNVSNLETNLATMKSQITNAQTITTSIISSASGTNSESASARTILQTSARNIRQAAASLRSALNTGNKIRIELMQMENSSAQPQSGTSSASPILPPIQAY